MSYYTTLKLDKSMYHSPKGFAQTLEAMDPSEHYQDSELAGLDAFQRQLKRFDIKVARRASDMVEKFFENSESATLFPEYVSRAVLSGMEENTALSSIIASRADVGTLDYRTVTTDFDADDLAATAVTEGSELSKIDIRLNEKLVTMNKRGKLLTASYEAIRYQRIDLFTVIMKQIGASIARAQLMDAVDAIVEGDGNCAAAEVIQTAAAGTITYADLLSLWAQFGDFELNTLLVSPAMMVKLLGIDELKEPAAGLGFLTTGSLNTPLGAKLVKVPGMDDDIVIGLDRSCALQMITAGGVVLDYDKLMNCQLERAAITSTCGFSRIFPDAAKVLQLKTA